MREKESQSSHLISSFNNFITNIIKTNINTNPANTEIVLHISQNTKLKIIKVHINVNIFTPPLIFSLEELFYPRKNNNLCFS